MPAIDAATLAARGSGVLACPPIWERRGESYEHRVSDDVDFRELWPWLKSPEYRGPFSKRTTGFEPATPGLGSQCSTN